jgi:hypothetical protein
MGVNLACGRAGRRRSALLTARKSTRSHGETRQRGAEPCPELSRTPNLHAEACFCALLSTSQRAVRAKTRHVKASLSLVLLSGRALVNRPG